LSFSGLGGGDFTGATVSGIKKVSFTSNTTGAAFNPDQVSTTLVLDANGNLGVTVVIDNATQFSAANWTLIGWAGSSELFISGTTGDDTITGSVSRDQIDGGLGADVLNGGAGNDLIGGGIGSDVIRGGRAKDDLFGHSEADIFAYDSTKDSKKGASHDVIHDFNGIQLGELDRISLSKIDAKAGVAGNQHFKFIGMKGFHHKAGELHYKFVDLNHDTVADTLIEGDINGDGRADFQIELTNAITLFKGDFIL
jgi:Ca2+-binding RTX toxin-like protein